MERQTMGTLKFGLMLTILLVLLNVGSEGKPVEFDYYVYAQQWPESVCLKANHTHFHNCSINQNTTAWTVHGLWPSMFGNATSPENCMPSAKFNVTLLEDIMPDLVARWPNLYTEEELISFWSHEWYKHGTCALAAKEVKNEHEYFKKGLDVNKKLDIYNNLRKRNVPPVDHYSYLYDDFLSAVMDSVGGKTVYLQCFREKHQIGSYVLQLEICLDKKLNPINCKKEHVSSCIGFPVTYPRIRHPF